MALAVATVVETTRRVTEARPRVRPVPRDRAEAAPVPAPEDGLEAMDDLVAAMGEMLRARRTELAESISEQLRATGVDPTVCAFLEDDLREVVDGLADVEVFFQESLEALSRPEPSPRVLTERAGDVVVLEQLEQLHLTFSNLRRRMVQVAAGVRRSSRRKAR